MFRLCCGLITILLLTFMAAHAADTPKGEESAPKAGDEALSPMRRYLDDSIAWEELFANDRADKPLEARVVLRWTNNTRGSEDGMTVLYVGGGRPHAVCCMYPWEGVLAHEFDSLSRGIPIAKRNGNIVWNPEKPGIEFKSVPGADVPANTPAGRLRQMKKLASEFSSTMLGWKSDNSDQEPLRLLPKPLYRYESESAELLDGAVFAFVQGTDPESLLLLEAFRVGERYQWQFAFGRRTSGELEGRHQGTIVWHVDRYPPNGDPRSTHINLVQQLPPELRSN